MNTPNQSPAFSYAEAYAMWARMVAGHAEHLDDTGARTLFDGVSLPTGPDAGGSYEGVTRMMYGWGAWLSQGRAPIVHWRNRAYDIAALMRQAVLAGCDPANRSYWGKAPVGAPGSYDQRTVEAGHTLFTLWQARQHTWDVFTPAQRELVLAYHERFAVPPAQWGNNWALFWLLNHATRKALGLQHDAALIEDVLGRYLDGVYCGDGWYDDAANKGAAQFDDYNLWVFASHVLMWAQLDPNHPRRAELLARVQRLMAHMPYFFAADGHYAHYGRSLSYKFARLGALVMAYQLGVWPHSVGMLKRLVGRHLRWHFDRGALDGQGMLRQTLTGQGSHEIRDPYNASGSQYWAMQAFGGLWSLPDNDVFWQADEAPLPVENGDFCKVFALPGWVLTGSQKTGEVQRFVAGSTHRPPSTMPAKYDKLVYGTAAAFNAGYVNGQPTPDAAFCLADGPHIAHRCGNEAWAVGQWGDDNAAWLRMRYEQRIGGGTHHIDTCIFTFGECHIRAHRVTLDPQAKAAISVAEGAAAFGYSPGCILQSTFDAGKLSAFAGLDAGQDRTPHGRSVAICHIRGYDEVGVTQTWGHRHDLNSEYAHFALPLLRAKQVRQGHEFVCAVHIGQFNATGLWQWVDAISAAQWEADGTFVLTLRDGRVYRVAAI